MQKLWRKSLDPADIQQSMRIAVILPLARGGSLTNSLNYRSVSFTSLIVEVIERVMKVRIVYFREKNKRLNF